MRREWPNRWRTTAPMTFAFCILFFLVGRGVNALEVEPNDRANLNKVRSALGLADDDTRLNTCNGADGTLLCNENGQITEIHLPDADVSGYLARAIWKLPELTSIDLSNNQLWGLVPELPISSTRQLTLLKLNDNRLSGVLSATLARLNIAKSGDAGCELGNNEFACPTPLFAANCGVTICEAADSCVSASDCDDADECTTETCDGSGKCSREARADATVCRPTCASSGRCHAGSCVWQGSPPVCFGTDNCNDRGTCCDAKSGSFDLCVCDPGFTDADCFSALLTTSDGDTTTDTPASTEGQVASTLPENDLLIPILIGLIGFTLCCVLIAVLIVCRLMRRARREKEAKAKRKKLKSKASSSPRSVSSDNSSLTFGGGGNVETFSPTKSAGGTNKRLQEAGGEYVDMTASMKGGRPTEAGGEYVAMTTSMHGRPGAGLQEAGGEYKTLNDIEKMNARPGGNKLQEAGGEYKTLDAIDKMHGGGGGMQEAGGEYKNMQLMDKPGGGLTEAGGDDYRPLSLVESGVASTLPSVGNMPRESGGEYVSLDAAAVAGATLDSAVPPFGGTLGTMELHTKPTEASGEYVNLPSQGGVEMYNDIPSEPR